MSRKYRAGYRPKHRGRKLALVLLPALIILGGLGAVLAWDVLSNDGGVAISGPGNTVPQVQGDQTSSQPVTVSEPFYTFQLPPEWKEVERKNIPQEQSITWQSKKKGEDNRWLKIYMDRMPPDIAINRLLPVDPSGDTMSYRQISDNCANFTNPGSDNKVPAPSKWQQVNFICDLPNFVQNKVGTGSTAGLNKVELAGPDKGKHTYFFLYTDHNIQPDYNNLYNVIKTFKAK